MVLDCWRILPREKFEGRGGVSDVGLRSAAAHVPQAMAAEGD